MSLVGIVWGKLLSHTFALPKLDISTDKKPFVLCSVVFMLQLVVSLQLLVKENLQVTLSLCPKVNFKIYILESSFVYKGGAELVLHSLMEIISGLSRSS